MKNVHLIPTDKPSRLYKKLGRELKYSTEYFEQKGLLCINQNIYITSDEEIKEGDWFYNTISLKPEPFKACENGDGYVNCSKYSHYRIDCKKIILTTNQDLIKDSVQAIDDEFLEWFVKNPSCEEVEVGYGWIRLTETDNEGYWISIPDKQFEMRQEEPKQETLEDFIKSQPYYGSCTTEYLEGIEVGAKWQQERSYSKEELFNILNKFSEACHWPMEKFEIHEWFEQFKKK